MHDMKFMAFYLPQFHTIPENDKWWGEGFTDWVNVKRAKKYFPTHRQPRIPLGEAYYDLSKAEDLRKQAELAKKYGVYGFCFYHYWFEGKLLLEKPAKNLLDNRDIDINYCFSWANETWARTWDGKEQDILIKQTYGGEDEWEKHFLYFLDYFKDERYIKIDNRPMLVIYKKAQIPDLKEMVHYWNNRAKEEGFNGVYLVETLRDKSAGDTSGIFDARVEFEPARTLSMQSDISLWYKRIRRYSIGFLNLICHTNFLMNKIYSFESISKKSIGRIIPPNTFPGLFVGWDNSPRKRTMSTIITEPTTEEFDKYIKAQVEKAKANNDSENQFIFVNAWNEWAEGTYLEPDTVNKCRYLEIIHRYYR